jgi:hypothetical protein
MQRNNDCAGRANSAGKWTGQAIVTWKTSTAPYFLLDTLTMWAVPPSVRSHTFPILFSSILELAAMDSPDRQWT